MNELDKLVAQKNGPAAHLPPFHKYMIRFEPESNKLVKIVKEGSLLLAILDYEEQESSFLFSSGKKKISGKKIVINQKLLNTPYNIYYDDPDETEEERLAIINKVITSDKEMPGDLEGHRAALSRKVKDYDPKAELTFKKQIIKLNYFYTPVSEPEIAEESGDENQETAIRQPIDQPSEGFIQRIKNLINN